VPVLQSANHAAGDLARAALRSHVTFSKPAEHLFQNIASTGAGVDSIWVESTAANPVDNTSPRTEQPDYDFLLYKPQPDRL
jgi:hypothetical protein